MSSGITAARYEERLGRAAAAVGAGGPRRAAHRRRAGAGVADRVRRGRPGAADDARRARERAAHARRAAPRGRRRDGRAGHGRRARGAGPVGGDGRPVRPGRPDAGRRRAATGSLLVSDGLRAAFLLRLQAALPGCPLRRRVGARRARCARSRTPRRSSCCVPPRGRRPDRGGDARAAAWWAARRRTSRARSRSAWWTRATTAPSSGSWPAARTPPRRTTTSPTGSCGPVSRCCSTSAAGARATARTSRARSGCGGADGHGPDDTFRRLHGLVEQAQAAGRAAIRPGVALQDLDRAARAIIERGGPRRALLPPPGPRHRPGGPRGPVPRGGQHRAARGRATRSAWSRASTSRAATACASRTSRSAPPTGGETLNQVERTLLTVRGE